MDNATGDTLSVYNFTLTDGAYLNQPGETTLAPLSSNKPTHIGYTHSVSGGNILSKYGATSPSKLGYTRQQITLVYEYIRSVL